jgi:Galactose oxidase-like, Early set domain/Glyoxal oxidase N-terminus
MLRTYKFHLPVISLICTFLVLYLLWITSGVSLAVNHRSSTTANNSAGATSIIAGEPACNLSGDVMVAAYTVTQAGYTLTGSPSTVAPGGQLTVSWTAPSGRPSNDWVGLYSVGAPNSNFLWWAYTGGAASGSFTLSAPSQTGQYEFRYLLNDDFTDSVRSNTVTVGGGTDPRAVTGEWNPNIIQWPNITVHMHLLPNGKVLTYSDDVNGEPPPPGENYSDSYVWDVDTGNFTHIPINNVDSFCSGHSFLADGRLLATGGHIDNDVGISNAIIFDYRNNSWTDTASEMNGGRWYPTNTTLANGEVLVIGGNIDNTFGVNQLPEVYTTSGTWRPLNSAQRSLPLYSWFHQAPNGRVFNSGPEVTTRYLNTAGNGSWATVASTTSGVFRDYGCSVMYQRDSDASPGRVVIIGGGDPPTNSVEVIDLNATSPAWRAVSSMGNARRLHNATLLPDGKLLVTGGTSSPGFNDARGGVLAAELWDPDTEGWSTLASAQVKRLYHSVALLLPDGRVLVGGSGRPSADFDTNQLNAEIYSPPYLFKGARPSITSAPASVTYGQTFSVQTPNAGTIARVRWIRLGSVTHSVDMNQRINNVTAPTSRNLCPPGHYMLFILNANGVPSVARIIQIN